MHLFHYHLVTSELRDVEGRYLAKLGFDLVARYGRIGDEHVAVEQGVSWEKLDHDGFKLRLSELQRGAINVVVQPGHWRIPRVDHVGVALDEDDFQSVLGRAMSRTCASRSTVAAERSSPRTSDTGSRCILRASGSTSCSPARTISALSELQLRADDPVAKGGALAALLGLRLEGEAYASEAPSSRSFPAGPKGDRSSTESGSAEGSRRRPYTAPLQARPEHSYAEAGVSLETAGSVVERLRAACESTGATGFGAFAGLHALDGEQILAASTDGVGTKLVLARARGRLRDCGADLAAHCINDVLTCGARPLMLLDYVAANEIHLDEVADLVEGAAEVCRRAGVALVGGETAELPGIYAPGELDFAGTCVGIVSRSALIDGSTVAAGDTVIGFPSAGVHANGFTLVRSVLEIEDYDGDDLLAPTRLYLDTARELRGRAKAFVHVTGGGIPGNLERVVPSGLQRGARLGRLGAAPRLLVARPARGRGGASPRLQPRNRLVCSGGRARSRVT